MMYYCESCRLKIHEDDVDTGEEYYEGWGHEFTEEYLVCPLCGEGVVDYEKGVHRGRIYKPLF